MKRRVALVLLAAGQSLRFGSDKLLHEIDGVPMLSRMLRLYADAPLDAVFASRTVVLARERAAFAKEAEALGWRVVCNERPEAGQSLSVRLGTLDALQNNPDGILFSVADQPHLCANTVLRLLEVFDASPDRIVAPIANGRRGNPVLFPSIYGAELCALTGDVGGSPVIRRHIDRLLTVETDARELTDMDRKTEG